MHPDTSRGFPFMLDVWFSMPSCDVTSRAAAGIAMQKTAEPLASCGSTALTNLHLSEGWEVSYKAQPVVVPPGVRVRLSSHRRCTAAVQGASKL